MKTSERVYLSSPVFIQKLLVAIYGYRMYSRRYSGSFHSILKQIREAKSWNESTVARYQSENLSKIVHHCVNNVPYYRKLFLENGIDARDIRTIKDLQLLPILDKQTIREKPEAFRPDGGAKPYATTLTSGSTGTPLAIHNDEVTYKMAMALLVDFEEQYGVRFGARRASFAGRMIQSTNRMKPPFCRFNPAENQLLFSVYHLNEDTFPEYVRALDRFQPEEMIGHPSALTALASLFLSNKINPSFRPKLIVTNSENLLPWQRETIQSAFNCLVKDYYSTAEYVNFASEQPDGSYASNPLIGITEFESAGDDLEEKSLIMTTLTNYAMPLLRYRIGDVAIPLAKNPGFPGAPNFRDIQGRIDDYLISKDGRKIGRVSQIYKGISGIKEAQIVQDEVGKIMINVVEDLATELNKENLIKQARFWLGDDFEVDICSVDFIDRGKNGKFRSVVNNLARR